MTSIHYCTFDVPASLFQVETVKTYAKEMGIDEIQHVGTDQNIHYFFVSVQDPEKLIKLGMKLGMESVF